MDHADSRPDDTGRHRHTVLVVDDEPINRMVLEGVLPRHLKVISAASGIKALELAVGEPRPDLIDLVVEVCPTQCTLVPVTPGEITSQAGWPVSTDRAWLGAVVRRLQAAGIRVSLFVDPDPAAIRWAADLGADRVELYTEPFARACARGEGLASYQRYAEAAEAAHGLGLGVNAGHDLDLHNLVLFRDLPHLDEVSIGHALISHALWVGLGPSVRDFLAVLAAGGAPSPEATPRAV